MPGPRRKQSQGLISPPPWDNAVDRCGGMRMLGGALLYAARCIALTLLATLSAAPAVTAPNFGIRHSKWALVAWNLWRVSASLARSARAAPVAAPAVTAVTAAAINP